MKVVPMAQDLYGRRDVKRRKSDINTHPHRHGSSTISSTSFLSLKAELARQQQQHHQTLPSSTPSQITASSLGDDHRHRRTDTSIGVARVARSQEVKDEYTLATTTNSHAHRGRNDLDKAKRKLPEHLLPSSDPVLASSKARKRISTTRTKGSTKTLSPWSSTPSAQLERDRNLVLERKARLYEQLKKGLSGGLSVEDLQEGGKLGDLVDWERKMEQSVDGEEHQDTESENGSEAGDLVEYQDDLGRTRKVPRSQVPMASLIEMKRREEETAERNSNIPLYGPQHHFPIFTTSSHAHRQLDDQQGPSPPEVHFDSKAEVRNRGAAFYQFAAGDEEARKRQMEKLNEERQRTLRERAERRGDGGDADVDEGEEDEGIDNADGHDGQKGGMLASSDMTDLTIARDSTRAMSRGEKRLADRRAFVEALRNEVALAKIGGVISLVSQGGPQEAGETSDRTADSDRTVLDRSEQQEAQGGSDIQQRLQQRAIDRFLQDVDEEFRSRTFPAPPQQEQYK